MHLYVVSTPKLHVLDRDDAAHLAVGHRARLVVADELLLLAGAALPRLPSPLRLAARGLAAQPAAQRRRRRLELEGGREAERAVRPELLADGGGQVALLLVQVVRRFLRAVVGSEVRRGAPRAGARLQIPRAPDAVDLGLGLGLGLGVRVRRQG